MSKYDEQIKYASEQVLKHWGQKPKRVVQIYTTLDHVSRSGMMRKISAFIMVKNQPVCIGREIRVTGCGMDMGFDLAYNIFHTAYSYGKPRYQVYLDHRWM